MRPTLARLMLAAVVLPPLAGCGFGNSEPAVAVAGPDWAVTDVRVVSKIDVHAGVVAFTGLTGDHRLRTVVLDKTTGKQLWARPATTAGRPSRLGVGPPAIIPLDGRDAIVAAIEPDGTGGASLVARDARDGAIRWRVPIHTSYGPQRCGSYICISDDQYLYLRSPHDGEIEWHANGPATVATSSAGSAVLFRWGDVPALQKRDLDTGEVLWEVRIARILGPRVDTAGVWSFSRIADLLIGYVGPGRDRSAGHSSAFGYFAVRLSDGALMWRRENLVAVRPSPRPGVLLLARQLTERGGYGGYVVVAPRTGRLTGSVGAGQTPARDSVLAVSASTELIGFYQPDQAGRAFALDSGVRVDAGNAEMWTFCEPDPSQLEIPGLQGFYAIRSLCRVDLSTGRKLTGASPVPPEWYTGRASGWRIWRGPKGGAYGWHVGYGDSPGLYLISDR